MTTITTQLADALRALLDCSKSDAWNGSMKLDDALEDSREALAEYDARKPEPPSLAAALRNIAAHDYITGCGPQLDHLFKTWIDGAREALAAYNAQRCPACNGTGQDEQSRIWGPITSPIAPCRACTPASDQYNAQQPRKYPNLWDDEDCVGPLPASDHTAEPWRAPAGDHDEGPWRTEHNHIHSRHRPVAIALNTVFEPNARRIVACVNACAGIPTHALEGQYIQQLHQTIADLELQLSED